MVCALAGGLDVFLASTRSRETFSNLRRVGGAWGFGFRICLRRFLTAAGTRVDITDKKQTGIVGTSTGL